MRDAGRRAGGHDRGDPRRHRRGRVAASTFERLDGLVNNAGIAIAAPLEDLPLDELRRQLEVNVVGQLAVTQAVLPALRAARGRIVIVGSIAGRSALPFLGAYAMSKFALEAMADSLRLELAPDGIEVALVEPGTIATRDLDEAAAAGRRRLRALPARRSSASARLAAARAAKAAPVDLVADAIEHALTAERPKTRYLVGRDAKIRAAIERLPDRLRDRVLTRALLERLRHVVRSRPCAGQMMDFQLTLPHLLRRAETYYPRQGDRHPAPRQELPPLRRTATWRGARSSSRSRSRASGSSAATASRRSAGTTTSTSSATSASRAAGSCSTR